MYAVEGRDHIMIGHSLPGEFFGPAQGLHGVTYVVEATFEGPSGERFERGVEAVVVAGEDHRLNPKVPGHRLAGLVGQQPG